MPTDKSNKKTRMIFITSSKYQRDIVLLSILPTALVFLTFIIIIFLGNPGFIKTLFHRSLFLSDQTLDFFSKSIIFLICVFFWLSLVTAFIISHNMIGASERIIKELDEIIAGRSQKTISSRPNDTMTKELLKRINYFIEAYLKTKNKNP